MSNIFLDLETRSSCDLKREGGRRYAVHPSTELLTAAWYDEDTRQEHIWFPEIHIPPPQGVVDALLPNVTIHVGKTNPIPTNAVYYAHNAFAFDRLVWREKYQEPTGGWVDTEPFARRCGLPGGIDKIGERLLGQGKNKSNKSLMLKYSRASNKYPGIGELCKIGKYNLEDVRIMYEMWRYVQKRPTTEEELRVYQAHCDINDFGVRVDTELMKEMADLQDVSIMRTLDAISRLTDKKLSTLEDLRSRTKVFQWIEDTGGWVGDSLKKATVEQIFREYDEEDSKSKFEVPDLVRDVLTLRFAALRITGSKVSSAMSAVHAGRLHDILAYFGAHTGRWSGRKFQPQNLPRPKPGVDVWRVLDFRPLSADKTIEIMDTTVAEMKAANEWDEKNAHPTLDDANSSLLRSIIIPDEGYLIAAADFNAIEFRMAGWLANAESILGYFRRGECPYMAMIPKLYGTPGTSKKDPRRQVTKVVNLGGIYGIGETTMGLYALAQGVDLQKAGTTPLKCVNTFRDEFPELAGWENEYGYRTDGLWHKYGWAAMNAVRDGKITTVGKCTFKYDGQDLRIYIPSGRAIYYHKARIDQLVPPWGGEPRDTVTFMNPSKNFREPTHGGKLMENIDQATCRDRLAYSIVRLKEEHIRVLIHVHDEPVSQVRDMKEAEKKVRIMLENPPWLPDFPIAVECDVMERYAKMSRNSSDTFTLKN